ncbi:MAG TPA: NAD(P)-binding protein, partial [Oceanobacillus sp.]|nr:NAD(P)-binding protein [Oceanobacillus sp.]
MKHDLSARVCVIGAGSSGIAAAKNLLQVGLRNIVVYEKNEAIGGNWLYSPRLSHSSVYET